MIQPLNDNLLIKVEVQDKTEGGLYLPKENIIEEKGKVLAKGNKVKQVNVDDTVYFKSWAIDRINLSKDEDYAFIKEELILGYEKV